MAESVEILQNHFYKVVFRQRLPTEANGVIMRLVKINATHDVLTFVDATGRVLIEMRWRLDLIPIAEN
jgi:hypothetical protein